MTPIYLNSMSNDEYNEHQFFSPSDPLIEHQFLSPNSQASSSSNSLTCHLFFNPNDQDGLFDRESHPSQLEGDNFGSQVFNDLRVENRDDGDKNIGGLKFSLWKRETYDHMNDENQVKWMSSKMRVMLKMKKSDPTKMITLRPTATEMKLEDHHQDHKEPASPPLMEENDNSNSFNSTSSNNNIAMPVRVCSDCNTTKTPLWRSGPRGPKSLCNACGIRQRKARKAMAAAAAAAAETGKIAFNHHDKPASLKVTKVLHKDHKKPNGYITKYKKRQYPQQINTNTSPSSSSPTRKNCVEEFLVSLNKNLTSHRVFPQDEKEAAILLMALSYGYVHE